MPRLIGLLALALLLTACTTGPTPTPLPTSTPAPSPTPEARFGVTVRLLDPRANAEALAEWQTYIPDEWQTWDPARALYTIVLIASQPEQSTCYYTGGQTIVFTRINVTASVSETESRAIVLAGPEFYPERQECPERIPAGFEQTNFPGVEPFAAWVRAALVDLPGLPPLRQDLHLTGHTSDITHASFSPDGQRVVTASCDLTARVWDARTGAEELVLTGHERSCVNWASFSPDGRWIVTAGNDFTARVWDAVTGEQVRLLAGHTDLVNSAEFSPDGTRIATAGGGPGALEYAARLWDAATGEALFVLNGHARPVLGATFSPDGNSLLTWATANSTRVWDIQTGQQRYQVDSGWAAYSPDGQQIVVMGDRDGVVHIYEAASGRQVFRLLPGERHPRFNSAKLSPDGRWLITTSQGDPTAEVWDAESGAAWGRLTGHTAYLTGILFSPDGRFILTTSADRTAALWDAASGQRLRQFVGHTNDLDAAFSPELHSVLTYSQDDTAWLWDISDLSAPN